MKKILFVLLISFFLCVLCPFAVAQEIKTTKAGYYAALTKDLLQNAIDYHNDKDAKALNLLLKSGSVIILKAGIKVHVYERSVWYGFVKVRPRGKDFYFWTLARGIE